MAQVLNVRELKVDPVLAVEDLGAVLGVDSGLALAAVVAVQTSTQTSKTDTNVDRSQVGLLGGRRRGSSTLCGRSVLAEALTNG